MVTEEGEVSMDPLERLMAHMPKIAAAVNEFGSAEVQIEAFRALMDEYRGQAKSRPEATRVQETPASERANGTSKGGAAGEGRRSRRGGAVRPDATLDVRPQGVQSLADFVQEKKPGANQDERNVASAYWLSQVAGHAKVTADQIAACYLAMKWRQPANMRNSLQVTASTKRWLDTQDAEDIKVTVPGLNFVRHDLPRPAAAS
jgi:hypothetical protein